MSGCLPGGSVLQLNSEKKISQVWISDIQLKLYL